MENSKTLKLTESHRGGVKSFSFSGRPNGIEVRKELNLDEKDKDHFTYKIELPSDTTSFNPSFYLGLFFDSIVTLKGIESFKEKYHIDIKSINKDFQTVIEENLQECSRKAYNEYINPDR